MKIQDYLTFVLQFTIRLTIPSELHEATVLNRLYQAFTASGKIFCPGLDAHSSPFCE